MLTVIKMKCTEHGKTFVGHCTWCGKELCKLCVAKYKGTKLYCTPCAAKLDNLPKREKVAEPVSDLESHPFDPGVEPQRSSTFSWDSSHKLGYFDFSALVEKKKQ